MDELRRVVSEKRTKNGYGVEKSIELAVSWASSLKDSVWDFIGMAQGQKIWAYESPYVCLTKISSLIM